MIRHLTAADYQRQPWANGRGETVELARADGPGGMLWRLSVATVAEAGPFSLLPGIERVLTVISGPGFALEGEGIALDAAPLVPVAFPGDVPVAAVRVAAPSEDFNVMVARSLPRPEVAVIRGSVWLEAGGLLAVLALGPARVAGRSLDPRDLLLLDGPVHLVAPQAAVVVRLG